MICIIIHSRHPGIFSLLLFSLLLFFWVVPFQGRSQDYEVGVYGGVSYYLGDLNPGVHFQNVQPAYGILLRYNIDTRWAVKMSGYRGTVKGSSAQSTFLPDQELSFESPVTDISAEAEFNFLEYFVGSRRNFVSPYIYAGVSVFFFNPKSGGTSLRTLGTEGQNIGYDGRKPYSLVGFDIPFGLGVKFSVSRKIGLAVFWEMHKTFTDYLDDVSKTYYLEGPMINPDEPSQYLSDPTMDHQPGMQRGNSRNYDWYSFSGITLTYKFSIHGSRKCHDQKFR
jgi:hypothetical protein